MNNRNRKDAKRELISSSWINNYHNRIRVLTHTHNLIYTNGLKASMSHLKTTDRKLEE